MRIYRHLGVDPKLQTSSTDANIPIALGIPAICLGVTRGGNAHNTREYIETEPIAIGLKALYLNIAAAAFGARA